MTLEAIVARYGLAALFAGAALEGEAAVITGGVLAQRGAFPLPAAMATAVAGSFLADQLYFFVGRRFRDRPFVRRVQARPAFARALALFGRYPRAFIFTFRFLYGVRTVSPVAIGTTAVSHRLFVAVNLVSAAVWGTAFSALGYASGHAWTRAAPTWGVLLGVAAAVLAAGSAIALLVRWRRRA